MRSQHISGLVLLVALIGGNFVCLNLFARRVSTPRVDLTEGHVYTLAKETVELLKEPDEPVDVFFYYSPIDKQHDKLKPLIGIMSDTLREFQTASEGKVVAHLVDWDAADKDTQERATTEFGVRSVPINVQTAEEEAIKNSYFAVVVAYGDQSERYDLNALIKTSERGADGFNVDLQNIEYLVAKAIHKVVRGFQSIGAALATADLKAKITLVFSPAATLPKGLKDVPGFADKTTKKLIAEGAGRITVETIDPTGDAPDKAKARRELRKMGIRPMALEEGQKDGFFAFAILEVGDKKQAMPLFNLGGELTEGDVRDGLRGALRQLVPGFMTTVGVVTADPPVDPMAAMRGQQPPPGEFAFITERLGSEFDVRTIDLKDAKAIPREVSVLLLLRPQELSDRAVYEIDQFVMRGGRLVVCADAFGVDIQTVQQTGRLAVKATKLGKLRDLLKSWGADVDESMMRDIRSDVVRLQKPVSVGGQRFMTYEEVKYPYLIFSPAEALAKDNPIMAGLESVTLGWAAPVALLEPRAADAPASRPGRPATVRGQVLIWSSKDSSPTTDTADADRALEPKYVYAPPKDAAARSLAVALQGVFPSYFADKPIPGAKPESAPADGASEDAPAAPTVRSSSETSVIVFGDADFVSRDIFEMLGLKPDVFAHNLGLLRNALDFGGPDQQLMGIRSREQMRRPLTGLRGVSPEDRPAKTAVARWASLLGPLGVLSLSATVWFALRAGRRPLVLPPSQNGGVA